MTDPGVLAPHGYPDWQRQVSVVDTRLDEQTNQAIGVNTVFGPYFVGNFQALGLLTFANAGRVRCSIGFFGDAALTLDFGSYDVRVDTNNSYFGSIPVLGPYARVAYSDETGAGSNIDFRLFLRHWRGVNQPSAESQLMINVNAVNIAAGATRNDPANFVWPATAYLCASNDSPTSEVRLQYLTSAGGWVTFYRVLNIASLVPTPVALPAMPVRLAVTNTSAALHVFTHSLVCSADSNLG